MTDRASRHEPQPLRPTPLVTRVIQCTNVLPNRCWLMRKRSPNHAGSSAATTT
ncbi:hypothetical protein BCR44DRAFT_1436163, partial [Catenaria anguillulae PL171]